MKNNTVTITNLGYCLVAVLTVFNGIEFYRNYVQTTAARKDENVALKKIGLVYGVTSALRDGEIHKRSNLSFTPNNYQWDLNAITKNVSERLNELQGMENEPPDPQRSVEIFIDLVRRKLAAESEALVSGKLIVDTVLLDQIRQVANDIGNREELRIDAISANIGSRQKDSLETASWSIGAALLLLLLTSYLSNRYAKTRLASESALLAANEKLKKTENFSNSILQSSHECTMVLGLNGFIRFISYGGQSMLKIGDERINTDWLGLWTNDFQTAANNALNLAKEGEVGRFTGEFTIPKFGVPPWLDVEISPIRATDLEVTQLLVTCHNVTARKRAEDRYAQITSDLQISEANLKGMMEAMPQLIWTASSDGTFKEFNQRWQKYTGLSLNITLDGGWEQAIHPDDVAGWAADWIQAQTDGESFDFELRIRQASDGNFRWHTCRAESVRNAENKITKWIGTCTDIHDQKQAAAEVSLKHQKLKSFLDVAPVALWATDRNGAVIVSEGKLKSVANVASAGTELLDGRWLETSYSPLFSPDGAQDGLVGVAADVTDKKMYELARKESEEKRNQLLISEKAAVQAYEMKSKFFASLSHDLRIPLNGVLGMSSLLKGTELTEEQREYISAIQSSADALLVVVNDILDLSKAAAGKTELVDVDFEPQRVMEELEKSFQYPARKKGLDLKVSFSPEIPRNLKGDAARLRQVLTNLASNAIKYTSEGQVSIRAFVLRESLSHITLQFEVADTGVGISKKMIQRLFQLRSADSGKVSGFGGVGMGLAISKHLVGLMGGEIGARANAGKGATFFVTIPFVIEEQVEAVASAPAIAQVNIRNLKVLVAEDNSVNSLLAARMLEKMGHSVVTVANGHEAIATLDSNYFDLVFMDCQMPELDGYEATRRIRADVKLKHHNIPIIAMTGNALHGDREKCLECGMNDYISKPMTSSDLASAINRCLQHEIKVAS